MESGTFSAAPEDEAAAESGPSVTVISATAQAASEEAAQE